VAVSDFNGDGKADLVVGGCWQGFFGALSILLGNGDGTFQTLTQYPPGGRFMSVSTGDFNGDGHSDIVATNYDRGSVSVLLGNGDGTFQTGANYAVGTAPSALVAGDFNDWGNTVKHMMADFGFHAHTGATTPTYPSRLPLVQLDHVYARGVRPLKSFTPQGAIWARMSDHLPLLVEFAWDAP
jgi:endonuclease/exonuclease/phosphatase family metal-dependent hydrolase